MTAAPGSHERSDGRPVPVASYRLQLGPELGFDAVVPLLDQLATLGVSHLYLSPVAEAVPGSGHGYDVVDHTRWRAELGGADAFARLLDAADVRGLRVVVDHVPNHASTSRPELNGPWWEMLRDGPDSPAARWFDVDWEAHEQRVVLPVLPEPLEAVLRDGGISVVDGAADGDDVGSRELLVGEHLRLPLAPATADRAHDLPLADLLDLQHYRLVWWRDPRRNVRRFFTIDDLVAVRAEHDEVAATIDRLPAEVASHAGFGGVRVDHVDGLADPAGYLAGLRSRIGDAPWLVVEKILAPDEGLHAGWPVDGTTGYEFARVLDQVMVVPAAAATFDRLWREAAAADARLAGDFADVEDRSRREVLAAGLRPDVERTVAAAVRALGDSPELAEPDLEMVVTELTVRLPRYRTYLPDDIDGVRVLDAVADALSRDHPELSEACGRFRRAVIEPSGPHDEALRTRWQQLTGPAMAKGAEDRAFFRYLRFAALCEVGGEPGRFGIPIDEFHAAQAAVGSSHPLTMLAASTHDTKRSGDVRARAAALTAVHEQWAAAVGRWATDVREQVDDIDAPTVSLALQTAVTCPELTPERLAAFLVKSAREAELHTSWTEPDEVYEDALGRLAHVVVGDHDVARDVAAWSERLDRPGRAAAIAATAVRFAAPGVPDTYQGTEVFSHRLVDPDNREAPDWDALAEEIAAAATLDGPAAWAERPDAAKAVVAIRMAALRRRRPDVFADGAYRAVDVRGADGDRALAFARGDDVVVAVALPGLDLASADGPLELDLAAVDGGAPSGSGWSDVLSDPWVGEPGGEGAASVAPDGVIDLRAAFARFPAVVLERRR